MKEERWERIRRLVDAMVERRGEDVVVLDVSEVTSFADTFLIATGRSERLLLGGVSGMFKTFAR